MLVGVDASRAVTGRATGTEGYSRHLIRALLALDTPHRFRLYLRSKAPPEALYGTDSQTVLRSESAPPEGRVEVRSIPFPRLWTHVRLSWEMARRPPDALFVPAHVLPLVHPRASLVTVHDLGYLHFPAAHPRLQRAYLDLSTRWNVRAAAHVLAISEATRADLVARYGVPPGRITVAHHGRDERLVPVEDPAEIEAVKARYGIGGPYYVTLGTLQPRKNLFRLVEAFAPLAHGATLVLAGKRGWLVDDLPAHVRRLGLEGRVLFPGYVREEDKAALLGGALALVFVSLYEGFGLPVVEAQSCGCPVVASTTSSLPEVAGDGALLVDPLDTEGITAAMERVAGDPALRAGLVERGLANARRFSWERCARITLAAIERCAPPEG